MVAQGGGYLIEADGIAKRYGSLEALRPLHLRVAAGEVFGLLGPNGAGKSTATKILCGLVRPSEGRARIAGHDVIRSTKLAQAAIGYLPERVPVYRSLTAREYLLLFARLGGVPLAQQRGRVEAELQRVSLMDVERKPVGKFSKGMVQRLGLARALLTRPRVLFLDEPASGLDPTGRREIRTLIQTLARAGCAVMLCSHDLAEVQAVCHRVGFLRRGELVHSQHVGEVAGQIRRFLVEVVGAPATAVRVLRDVPGLTACRIQEGKLSIEARPGVARTQIAVELHKAGVAVLGVEEEAPDLETLYRRHVEALSPGVRSRPAPSRGRP